MKLTIDGKSVSARDGDTVLEVAKAQGIYIPTLCHLENLKPYGACRLCMVEIEGLRGYPTACTTPVTSEMRVITKSETLQNLRREIFELTLSEHPYTCLVCKDNSDCRQYMNTTRKVTMTTGCNFCSNNGDCELQEMVNYLELKDVKYPINFRNLMPKTDNPFYDLDYNLCILCGRCVRVCNEEENSGVLALVSRGSNSLVGTSFNESQKDAGCEYCGACIDVCPTGAISAKIGKWQQADRATLSTCTLCSVGCEININSKKKEQIINIGAKKGRRTTPLNLCVRGKFTLPDLVHHPQRVKVPLIRRGEKWIEVTWEEAISYAVSNLERYRGNQMAVIGSSQSSLEENFVLQKFARKVMRSNNVDMLSSYPDRSIINKIHNTNRTFEMDSILKADTILVLGADGSLTHPQVEKRIRKAVMNEGANLILANSYPTRTDKFSNQDILIKGGEEYHFILGLQRNLLRENSDPNFNGLREALESFKSSYRADIELLSKTLIASKNIAIIVSDGVLRDSKASYAIEALHNIQIILKKWSDSQIVFLGGEGNHIGGVMVGMHPDYLPNFSSVDDQQAISLWSKSWGVQLSSNKGFAANEIVNNIAVDGITALYINGDIPAHPNFKDLKFLIQANMFLTETSKYADLFLPITSLLESDGHFLDIRSSVKNIVSAISPLDNVKEPWKIISMMARGMVEKGFAYNSSKDIFNEISDFINLASTKEDVQIRPITMLPSSTSASENFKVPIIVENNCYHYLGNIFSSLIDNMQSIREEGLLKLSKEMALKLEIEDGDLLDIESEYGAISGVQAEVSKELQKEVIYFRPKREHIKLVSSGINIDQGLIYSKISKSLPTVVQDKKDK